MTCIPMDQLFSSTESFCLDILQSHLLTFHWSKPITWSWSSSLVRGSIAIPFYIACTASCIETGGDINSSYRRAVGPWEQEQISHSFLWENNLEEKMCTICMHLRGLLMPVFSYTKIHLKHLFEPFLGIT